MKLTARIDGGLETVGMLSVNFKAVAIYLGSDEWNEFYRQAAISARDVTEPPTWRGVPVYRVHAQTHFYIVRVPVQPSYL